MNTYNGYRVSPETQENPGDSEYIGQYADGTYVPACDCLQAEIWRPVRGHEFTHQVSNHGRVRRLLKPHLRKGSPWRVLKASTAPRGYQVVNIGRTRNLHVVVLEAWKGPRPKGKWACHNDGDQSNNHLSNLRWDTPRGNFQDRDKHGNTCRGSRRWNAKLTEADVPTIHRLRESGKTQKEIADCVGVSQATVGRILAGKLWKHVPRPQ